MRFLTTDVSHRLRERAEHPSAGAWVELLPIGADDRVLIVDVAPSRARARVAATAGTTGIIEDAPHTGIDGVGAPLEQHLERAWDWVIIDGAVPERTLLTRLAQSLAPDGRLVVVVDNPWSPLKQRPPLSSPHSFGPDRPGHTHSARRLRRHLRSAGLVVDRWFGLFRSSTVATTAFDIAAPRATQAVFAAALVHQTGTRAAGVRLLRRLPAQVRLLLVPGWLVVARTPPADGSHPEQRDPDSLPIVGRMGYERTPDSKILLGEPPAAMERTYAKATAADSEAMALEALAAAGLRLAPKLLARPRPGTCRTEWVTAHNLPVRTMPDDELVRWTEEAARLLGRIQVATMRADGTVLVHGDYWLGNTLAVDGHLRWVIDWGTARWGDPAIDQAFLVTGLEGFRPLTPALIAALRQAVERGLSAAGAAAAGDAGDSPVDP